MALVELGKFYNNVEAAIVQSRLEADGVDSVLFDTGMTGQSGFAIPVRLMVDKDDLARARRILSEISDRDGSG